MTRGRLFLSAVVALIVALGLGYAWGASGRRLAERTLDDARQQLDLAEARGALLDARVSLYNNNFGDAARRLDDARGPLRTVKQRYQSAGRSDAAARIDAALVHLEEAKRLADRLDPSANALAGEALEAIKLSRE